MGEEQVTPPIPEQIPSLPDLPEGLAEPSEPPSVLWIGVRPDLFGLPPAAVAGIYAADLIVILGIALIVRRILILTRPRPLAPPLPPARDEALGALAALRTGLGERPLRDLALQLSTVLRRFAEREYGIGLTTQTQEEFRALLARYPDALPARFAQELPAFLERCDEAKFKAVADSAALNQQLWEEAGALVRHAPIAIRTEPSAP